MSNEETGKTAAGTPGRILRACMWWGLVLAVVLAPTQYGVEVARKTYVCLVDPLIWALLGLRVLLWLGGSGRGAWRPPPLSAWLFVLLAALSGARVAERLSAAKEVFQYAEYLLVAWLLFSDATGDETKRRRLTYLFLAVATVIVGIATVQYLDRNVEDLLVRGTFGNRNVLGGFLALALPMMFGFFLGDTHPGRRAWYAVTILAGLCVSLSGGTLIALSVSFAVAAMVRGPRSFCGAAVLIVGLLVFALPNLPRSNRDALHASVALFDDNAELSSRYPEWQAAAVMLEEQPILGVGPGQYQKNIGMYYGVVPSPPGKAEPDSQNLYLVLGSSLGLPALACFAALLLGSAVAAARGWAGRESAFDRGLALGTLGAIIAFAVNAVWCPMLVRGLGVPLALVLVLARSSPAGLGTKHKKGTEVQAT